MHAPNPTLRWETEHQQYVTGDVCQQGWQSVVSTRGRLNLPYLLLLQALRVPRDRRDLQPLEQYVRIQKVRWMATGPQFWGCCVLHLLTTWPCCCLQPAGPGPRR